METICICCPIGCRLKVEKIDGEIVVTGNSCPRGKDYGISEFTFPKRVLTTSLVFPNVTYTLKTTTALPKERVKEALKEIKKIGYKECNIGDVLIKNIINSDADVVVTGKIENA